MKWRETGDREADDTVEERHSGKLMRSIIRGKLVRSIRKGFLEGPRHPVFHHLLLFSPVFNPKSALLMYFPTVYIILMKKP